jgi:hypothetical protein
MNLVIVSSAGQCGIHECAQIMVRGFQNIGHQARFVGVKQHDSRDLQRKMRQISPKDELVIFEYEPGIFWPYGLIRAMVTARLWKRKKVILSIHEFSLDKFAEYLVTQDLWEADVVFKGGREFIRSFGLAGLMALRYMRLRLAFLLLARLPHVIVAHSQTTVDHLKLALHPAKFGKVFTIPLAVEPILEDQNAVRQLLGLPLDVFAFIIPGFIFRRKRIIQVIEQLPAGTELWVVGVVSAREADYLAEIEAYLADSPKAGQVRIIQDYGIEPYIQAADVVVLYYREIFQSAVASQAAGAGKPCIFSDLAGFDPFQSMGLVVRSPLDLHRAMVKIQTPSCYRQLTQATHLLRERMSPEQTASRYLETLGAVVNE